MTDYQISYNEDDKIATVQIAGEEAAAASDIIDTFSHNETSDPLNDTISDAVTENHVFYHHVRDALYYEGELDMSIITIVVDATIVLTAFSILPATVTLAAEETEQLVPTFTPTGATNKLVTYVSSDPTKATVDEDGLITAVATGSATITATADDGDLTDTCVVTVS